MDYLLGIDLGTSSVRSMIMDIDGDIKAITQEEYNFLIPKEGYAEMDPVKWWEATSRTIEKALEKAGSAINIRGIGFSGQMHGLVALDENGKAVCNAIIWCDQRSINQVERINAEFGNKRLGEIIHSPIATGFQAPSLLWIKENQPEVYSKIKYIVLPKDYIRYRLTGKIATDVTDAASTGYFDCRNRSWSKEFMEFFAIDGSILPEIGFPYEKAGSVTDEASFETGLQKGTLVSYGGADQVMQAVGNGIIKPGTAVVNIGTGGQIMMPLGESVYDEELRSHGFCFALPDTWYYMGAALSSGLALKWGRSLFDTSESFKEIDEKCSQIKAGSEGLVFLPYLAGERTPLMDPHARGSFFGLTLSHTRYHMYRAIMEGVAYSMRDCLEILTKDLHQECTSILISGGGAQSKLWTQIIADILDRRIYRTEMKEQASYGAAISAGIAAGMYSSYEEASKKLIHWSNNATVPNEKNRKTYDQEYEVFRELYHSTKFLMLACGRISQEE